MIKWLLLFLALASPALGQNLFVPNPPAGDNSNRIATTSWVLTNGGGALTVGTSPISGGVSGNVLTINSGVLGSVANSISINSTVCVLGGSCSPAGGSGITGLTGAVLATGPGTVAATLAQQGPNTVLANITGATASPTFAPIPSCTGSTNALQYSSGFSCASISAGSGIAALTGDVTATGPGTVAATLATVNSNVGAFGSTSLIPTFTVNAKGLITAAATTVIAAPVGGLTGLGTGVLSPLQTTINTAGGLAPVTSPTLTGATVTGSFTATGLVTNADLANSSVTVGGAVCTLGSTCTPASGSGTVSSATINQLAIYTAATTVGGLSNTNNSVLITSSSIPTWATTLPSGLTAPSLTVTTAFTATGLVTTGDIATQAANTVLANITSGSASPTAASLPTCLGSNSALAYQPVSGFSCNTGLAVINPGVANNLAYYATTSQSLSPIATANNGVLITSSGGVPSISSTLPAAVQALITNGSGGAFGTFAYQNSATPPAIGGTTPNTGSFTTLNVSSTLTTNMTGGPFCVQETAGVLSSTGATCGSGGGGAVNSVSPVNSTVLIPTTTGAVTVGLNLANVNTWTGAQTFSAGAVVTSSFTATGLITLPNLAIQGANTILANTTGITASPTAMVVTSCSTGSSALIWTTNTGIGCNSSITAAVVPLSGITGFGAGVATALTNASGVAGGFAPVTSPTLTGATVTGSFTATGLVTNADLVNNATTVNGTGCTLGSTCTVTAAAGTLTGSGLNSTVTASSLTTVGTLTSLIISGTLTTNMTGGPFCVHETSGVLSATASDCGAGGGGTPGGSTSQIQYNNAGAFGGASAITTNGTTSVTIPTQATLNTPDGGSWSNLGITGLSKLITTGTVTAGTLIATNAGALATPAIVLNTCGTNCGFYSAGASKLDFTVAGTKVLDYGDTNAGQWTVGANLTSTASITASATGTLGWFGRASFVSTAVGTIQLGGADTTSPNTMTIKFQNQITTNNTAPGNATIQGPLSTGNASADIILTTTNNSQSAGIQNIANTALTLKGGTHKVVSAIDLETPAVLATGSAPTGSGTCTITTQVGGNTSGTFVVSGACIAGTVILTFAYTATNGWACSTNDRTTPTDIISQTASSQTTATLTGTMANSDVVQFACYAY